MKQKRYEFTKENGHSWVIDGDNLRQAMYNYLDMYGIEGTVNLVKVEFIGYTKGEKWE